METGRMDILALDFDGVICDSGREVFYTALHTYVGMHPDSSLRPVLERIGSLTDALSFDWQACDAYRAFQGLLPLGRRGEDFGVALRIIDTGGAARDQSAFNAFHATADPRWLRDFHLRLYRTREALRAGQEAAWFGLHGMYAPLARMLERHSGAVRYAIVTAKDRASVKLLLAHHGMDGLFDGRSIYDKETGVQKTDHLRALVSDSGVPFGAITFVDDKVNHLAAVSPLGVRCVLAGWGGNTAREWREAEARGFPVATLDTVEQVLFSR